MTDTTKAVMRQPTPAAIAKARAEAGHSQAQAAELVGLSGQARWSEYEAGYTNMDPVRWTLYLLLTGQHPDLRIIRKAAA
jgi:DNA-binding XRE family transcriptional regulator